MKLRGSLTVFATISIMLVAQLIFTLLEAARYVELKKIATMSADSSIESLFAEYCIPLWDNYNLLAIDAGNGEGGVDFEYEKQQLKLLTQENFVVENSLLWKNQANLLRLGFYEATPNSYLLMTDCNGAVYEKMVSSYMQNNIGYETAKLIYEDFQKVDEVTKNNKVDQNAIGNAQDALKKANSSEGKASPAPKKGESSKSTDITKSTNTSKTTESSKTAETDVENPLDAIESNQKKGILSVVMGDNQLSNKSMDTSNCVSKRNIQAGLNTGAVQTSWYDDALLEEYLLGHMSYYGSIKDNHALSYEIEYIIGGNDTDEENLKAVVNRILLIREAANMAYIMESPQKQSEVTALATSLGAISANPLVIEAIKYGLIAGWAYCESILDLRALLDGDTIPLVKTDVSWTSDLKSIATLLSGNQKAKSSKTGINYKGYLGTLLLMDSNKTKCFRAMDLQENTIRQVEGYSNFKMDNAICSMSVEMKYSYYTLFMSFVNLTDITGNHFSITANTDYSYFN